MVVLSFTTTICDFITHRKASLYTALILGTVTDSTIAVSLSGWLIRRNQKEMNAFVNVLECSGLHLMSHQIESDSEGSNRVLLG